MQRQGEIKREVLFVLLFVVVLGGLAILLTMREGAVDDQSFVRPELLGSQPKPQTTQSVSIPTETASVVNNKPNQDVPKDQQKTVTTDSGLKMIDLRIGGGDKAKWGSQVEVIYTGKLLNGELFDSNVGKRPYRVKVGVSSVIKGWHEGLLGMNQGGQRRLIIPSHLAYGEEGYPPKIPPRAELIFDLEVVSVSNE